MKLSLDESVPKRLATTFPDESEVSTVQENGWGGVTNGNLLSLAAENGFDALITADRGFEFQQNPNMLPVAVVILKSYRTRFAELAPMIPGVVRLLATNPGPGVYGVDA